LKLASPLADNPAACSSRLGSLHGLSMAVVSEDVGIVQLLDDLPGAVHQTAPTVWSVFARSLGEQGASGRTALAWRWALTGACPSPASWD